MSTEQPNLNGLPYYVTKDSGAIYIPLPREAWRSAGRCDCPYCKGGEGFWDTLAIPPPPAPGARAERVDFGHTWTVHFPELQRGRGERTPDWLTRGVKPSDR